MVTLLSTVSWNAKAQPLDSTKRCKNLGIADSYCSTPMVLRSVTGDVLIYILEGNMCTYKYIYIYSYLYIHPESLKDRKNLLAWFSKQSNHLYHPVSFQAHISLLWVFFIQVYLDQIYSPVALDPQNTKTWPSTAFPVSSSSMTHRWPWWMSHESTRWTSQGIQWWLKAPVIKALFSWENVALKNGAPKKNPDGYYSTNDKLLVWVGFGF